MSFWGHIVKAGKRYEQTVGTTFRVSHASLELVSGKNEQKGWTTLIFESKGEDFILCHLDQAHPFQNLDIIFEEGDPICFRTEGPGSIHLTGNLQPEEMPDEYDGSEAEEESESEEVPTLINGNNKKRKNLEVNTLIAKKSKKEDNLEVALKKAKNASKEIAMQKPKLTKKELMEADDDDDDEDDDDIDMEEGEEEEDDEEDGEEEEDVEDDSEEGEVSPTKGKKAQNGTSPQKTPSKKNDKTPSKKDAAATPQQSKKTPKKTLRGGIQVEELKLGNGPEAKRGKMMGMFYTGRLASNNKQFDATQSGEPFKFKLGMGEVIKGWDIGLEGMKVGGKRKVTIPPKMAYGNSKQGGIPANSTLVFDVECKYVK